VLIQGVQDVSEPMHGWLKIHMASLREETSQKVFHKTFTSISQAYFLAFQIHGGKMPGFNSGRIKSK
jgi:hypothetical protein